MNIKCSDELRRATSVLSNAADIIERNLTRRHPRSYCMPVLASIHAETHSDRVAEACSKVAERLAVLGGVVKTASKLASTLVKRGQCNIPFNNTDVMEIGRLLATEEDGGPFGIGVRTVI